MISRREIVSWILIGVALISIGIGYVKLDNNQEQIRAAQAQVRQEVKNRAYSECLHSRVTRDGERAVIIFSTKPADLTGLDPVRLKVVSDLNVLREKGRVSLLALLPEIKCSPNGAEVAKVQQSIKNGN